MIIDYSVSRPAMSALKAAGVTAVGRYIGWDSVAGYPSIGKNITATEAQEILGAGIDIFLAFEYVADAAANGTSQGTKDGLLTRTQLAELGAPPDMAVYFAVDFDIPDYAPADPDTPANALAKLGPVGQYFKAINALKDAYEVGVYGGYYAVKRVLDAGLATKAWQATAWSGGLIDPRAVLYQTLATAPIAGADVDVRDNGATVLNFGQWSHVKQTPPPPPIPQEEDVAFPMVLDLVKSYSVVVPVPAGKTAVILYADPGASVGGVTPGIRTGSYPKWIETELNPKWGEPARWDFPAGTTELTLTRTDAGQTVVTVDFA